MWTSPLFLHNNLCWTWCWLLVAADISLQHSHLACQLAGLDGTILALCCQNTSASASCVCPAGNAAVFKTPTLPDLTPLTTTMLRGAGHSGMLLAESDYFNLGKL